MISSSTGLLVLLGHPVAHSVSPAMHNAAIAAADLDLVYVALDVPADRIETALAGLPALGIVGANVTVPHKRAAAAACTDLTDRARALGAVNTLVGTPDGLVGDNTDVPGFLAGLPGPVPPTAVVVGSGGAARAVVAALVEAEAAVTLLARRPERGAELVASVASADARVRVLALDDPSVASAVGKADLVVNATPLGWHGERLPEPLHALGPGQVAYDLNYPHPRSPFLADAADNGAEVVDGLAMLVGQAAASFSIWTGLDPDVEVMTTAARRARQVGRDGT